MVEERLCGLPGCQMTVKRKNKIYHSASHKVKAAVLRKEKRARENRLIYRIDSLTLQDRRALFLSVAYSINRLWA